MYKKVVAFDFDGVIADTLEDAFVINVKHNPHLTWEMFLKMSHGNWWDSFESSDKIVDFHIPETYGEEYRALLKDISIQAEVDKAIRNLHHKGYYLIIVTSGSEPIVRDYLEKEGVLECFKEIFGFQTHKSKSIKFKQFLEKSSLKPSDVVFVTDTLGDILEANEVGIKSIGETWGLHDRETLEKGNPEIIIDDPALLEETVNKLLS